jgi:glycosyltransferase involved in cell wall biosynthesis
MTDAPRTVLHVIPALAPRYGGPSAAIGGFCRALEAAGVRTTVATTDADGVGRLDVPHGEPTCYGGIETVFFRRRLGEAFKWSSGMSAWLRSHVPAFDLVEVHAVFSHAPLAAGRACRLADVPYVVRPLGTLDPWSLARKPARKRFVMRVGGRELLRGAAAMHYTSAGEMGLAEAALPGLPPGFVVPPGVDETFFAAAPSSSVRGPGSHPYVLALARLHPKKGLDLLVQAFHAVADEEAIRDWRLVIAGEGDAAYAARLRALAESGPARERVQFRGWVTGDEKVELVRRAGLFALPSHQENFGISVAEAMAARVPVIVTPGVNLAPEIQAAGAGWVADRTLDSLAGALATAMRDEGQRLEKGEGARALAERFTWAVAGRNLRAAYEEVLGERK